MSKWVAAQLHIVWQLRSKDESGARSLAPIEATVVTVSSKRYMRGHVHVLHAPYEAACRFQGSLVIAGADKGLEGHKMSKHSSEDR